MSVGASSAAGPAARNLAVADDDDPVGDGLYFFDEVRDVDDGVAGASQLGDEREEPARVGLRQAAGRFVEHEDPAADSEGAADFNELLRGGGERGHRRVDRDLRVAQPRQDVGRGAPHVRATNQAQTRRLHAQQDVLGHRQVRRERELLVDHRDARAAGVERMRGLIRLAVECHAAGVWLQRARQDGHQRALAGAILPDDRAHLARARPIGLRHRRRRSLQTSSGSPASRSEVVVTLPSASGRGRVSTAPWLRAYPCRPGRRRERRCRSGARLAGP